MNTKKQINVGLIGFGNIGTATINTLNNNREIIDSRVPLPIRIKRIADLDITTKRKADYDPAILTNNVNDLFNDPEIDVIIELMGGVNPARAFVEKALQSGKHVVTANKALFSHHGTELLEIAEKNNVSFLYEASVGAGIPVIRSLQNSFCPNKIRRIAGILNGTCNYILTKMENEGKQFDEVLKTAQELGYAEPDPTFDIEGYDTAHKLSILASLSYGMDFRFEDIYCEGIKDIQAMDINFAKQSGYRIKLLGIATQEKDGGVELRVHPTLIPIDSQVAAVNDVYNCVMIDGDPIGKQMLFGRGAGQGSTSSGVISDLMVLSSGIAEGGLKRENRLKIPKGKKTLKPIDDLVTSYYIRMEALDVPGTMAKITSVLGGNNISIARMFQLSPEPGGFAKVIFLTHETKEAFVKKAIKELTNQDCIKGNPFILRIEEI